MPRPREYILYCDESVSKGAYFSNFYGGALVSSDHLDEIRATIRAKKLELNLLQEVKWQKITENYKGKYIDLIDTFFDYIACGKIKTRIMFTQNIFQARGLTTEQAESTYFRLYYQFIKHSFGFMHHPAPSEGDSDIDLRIYLDLIPDSDEKKQKFKGFICALEHNRQFQMARLKIKHENVTDVVSHDHDILQCLDIVLGSIQFRLNEKHKEKPPGAKRRGKRTIAKEAVYKHIHKRICQIRPNFNIGINTGIDGDADNRWNHYYRHWRFVPVDHVVTGTGKHQKITAPS